MESIETPEPQVTPETEPSVPDEAPAEPVTDLFGNTEPEATEPETEGSELSPEAEALQRGRHQMSRDLCYDIGGMALTLGGVIRGLVKLPQRNAASIVSDLAGIAKKLDDIAYKVKK